MTPEEREAHKKESGCTHQGMCHDEVNSIIGKAIETLCDNKPETQTAVLDVDVDYLNKNVSKEQAWAIKVLCEVHLIMHDPFLAHAFIDIIHQFHNHFEREFVILAALLLAKESGLQRVASTPEEMLKLLDEEHGDQRTETPRRD